MAKNILVVDDEQSMRDTLTIMLENEGFTIDSASNGKEALSFCEAKTYDLLITDLKMPVMDGIALVEALYSKGVTTPIIIMTAYATKDQAIRAVNIGAGFFIEKPFKKVELMNFINRSIKMEELIKENKSLKQDLSKTTTLDMIIGSSKKISYVKELIRKVSKTESTVLITGESGTGKEIAARALHALSNRSEGPFVAINCGAIPSELLESELFGHIKGSFTGAVKDKIGLMKSADNGTFFLDEVGNTALSLQVKILRAIQEREVMPVGGNTVNKIDVRFIAATNEDIENAIKKGEFRKDLYYRLNVINIHIPPLRERRDDIALLFSHFLKMNKYAVSNMQTSLPDEVLTVLNHYEWPGNIRELENVVERCVALSSDGKITMNMLPDHIRKPVKTSLIEEDDNHAPCMDDIEKAYIHWVLTQQKGQKQKAAEILGIGRSTLDRKIEKYGLEF